jgi:hypothetical protein
VKRLLFTFAFLLCLVLFRFTLNLNPARRACVYCSFYRVRELARVLRVPLSSSRR